MRVLLRRSLASKAVEAALKAKPHNAWVAPQKKTMAFFPTLFFLFFFFSSKENLVSFI